MKESSSFGQLTTPAEQPPPSTEPGWYEEPRTRTGTATGWRYWDGKRWTDHWAPTNPEHSPSFVRGALATDERWRVQTSTATGTSPAAGWYDDPEDPMSGQQRYWTGESWGKDARIGPRRLLRSTKRHWNFWSMLAMLLLLAVMLIILTMSGRGSELVDDEVTGLAGDDCASGMQFDAAPGSDPCATERATSPGDEPSTVATPEPANPATVVETPGACAMRTFTGAVVATLEGAPSGGTVHAESQVVIASDCSARIEFAWLVTGTDERFYSATNPEGNFCAMAEGEGKLAYTPDGQGGGALTGPMSVYPNIAASSSFDGPCPAVDRIGVYVLEGVQGEFSGTVSGTQLEGGGTFAHRQLPIAVTITAATDG